jgi:Putative Ig domain/IPT/TIG domain
MAIQKITTDALNDDAVNASKIASGSVNKAELDVVSSTGTGGMYVPTGTTAQRPGSPVVGHVRYNTTLDSLEQYTTVGWASIAPPPIITSISPTTFNGEQGTSITVNGSNFISGAVVRFVDNTSNGYNAATTTFVSSNQLTATTPQDFTVAQEPLSIIVTNPSGLSNTLSGALDCGGSPTWTTASGTLDTKYEGEAVAATVAATDPDAGATLSYSVASGLPSGVTINSSTGVISGTAATNLSNDTTYTFNGVATDNAGNTATRSFNIIIKNDPILDVTTLASFDGTTNVSTPNGYTISLNQITSNYTTGLSGITGGTWKGTGLFRLPVGSLPGDWKNIVAQIPTSGGTTICFWGKVDSAVSSSNSTCRPYDLYSRADEYLDFVRSTGVMNFSGGNINARTLTGNGSWAFTDWHFYCIRYSTSAVLTGSSQTQTVTIDNAGTLYSSSFTPTKNSASQTYSGFMGYNETNGSNYAWEGYTGGWKVITKNCTDAEVTALYNAGKGYFRP